MSATCACCGLAAPSSNAVGLTGVQRRVLQYLEQRQRAGESASYDEIAHAIGLGPQSKSRVCLIVKALVERGHVSRIPNAPRSIAVIGMQPEARA